MLACECPCRIEKKNKRVSSSVDVAVLSYPITRLGKWIGFKIGCKVEGRFIDQNISVALCFSISSEKTKQELELYQSEENKYQ